MSPDIVIITNKNNKKEKKKKKKKTNTPCVLTPRYAVEGCDSAPYI